MFKFKGISSEDMQVVIEEEEHFIARAAQRYEITEIEGRNGALFDEQGYSYVERPIYVQCLNINKIDDILAWLNGEGEFEYKGRKTIARFYSELEPQRSACIRIIDTTFIRDPFWYKADDEFEIVKERKDKNITGENITLNDSAEMEFKELKVGGNSWQETRSGKNELNITSVSTNDNASFDEETKEITLLNGFKTSFFLNFPEMTFKSGKTYLIEIFLSKSTTNSQKVEFLLKNDNNNVTDNWLDINSSSNYYVVYYTPSEDTIANRLQIYGSSTNAVDGDIQFKVQIRENTTESGYEPYGAMPSPEFPSEIKNVTGSANITVCNKNIADVQRIYEEMREYSPNFVSEEVIDNKYCIKFYNNMFIFPDFKGLQGIYKKNTQYTFRFLARVSDTTLVSGHSLYLYVKYTDGSRTSVFKQANGVNWIEFRIVSDITKTVDYISFSYSTAASWLIDKESLNIIEGDSTDYIEHKSQVITFPLQEGQRLYKGSYLADDGTHHKRGQVVLDELTWTKINIQDDIGLYTIKNIPNIKYVKTNTELGNGIAEKYKIRIGSGMSGNDAANHIAIDVNQVSVNTQEIQPTGIFEYELAEEVIEPYTEEQQIVYNQIKKATSYKNVTHIFSTDEISPQFDVTYIAEANEKILNAGNIQSRPILRLEKTISDSVELTINNVRFKYNFKEDKYVEIDCEEKTIKYENLNRSRQIEIGYEFPKLEIGNNNNIIMHTGDCIIQAKRKDRWL